MMEKEVKALLLDTHGAIEDAASHAIEAIKRDLVTTTYPFNASLTNDERKALSKLKNDLTVLDALKKIIVDAASYPVFHLFTLMDGVADPHSYDQFWSGVRFVSRSVEDTDDFVFLHDEFYATYDDWKNQDSV